MTIHQAFSPGRLAAESNVDVVRLRRPEWVEHQLRWRWLLDSLEGGERYRQAVYGWDTRGEPVRNLVRHKREYGDPRERRSPSVARPIGADPAVPATDDDYEMRRSRTPIPTFVAEVVDAHLGRIFARKVRREFPDDGSLSRVEQWSIDVDGKGTTLDDWMENTVARVLLAAGCCDVLAAHPDRPEVEVRSRLDELVHGLDRIATSIVLPQNLTYWELDSRGRYTLAVVSEWPDGVDDAGLATDPYGSAFAGASSMVQTRRCNHRVWTPDRWVLYDPAGERIASGDHSFGRVPIVRIGCRPKPRCENVYQSPLESVAERQREFYNRDSELILSDNYHSHPIIQGPEDLFTEEGQVKAGPQGVLPKRKYGQGTTVGYEPWEVLSFPTEGADSLRKNKSDLRDEVDRDAALTKPAGASGSERGAVSQSGVSKEIDNESLHDRLSAVSKVLERSERAIVGLVADVSGSTGATRFVVAYPTQFGLSAPEKIAKSAADFQALLRASGQAPEAEKLFLSELVRKSLPGRDDSVYERVDDEIEAAVERNADALSQAAELGPIASFAGNVADDPSTREKP